MKDAFEVYTSAKTAMQRVEASLKESILEEIRSTPDAGYVKMLSDNPRCFTVPFSKLGSNWSPKYHDVGKQREYFAFVLKNNSLEPFFVTTAGILRKGYYPPNANTDSRTQLHENMQNTLLNLQEKGKILDENN